MRWWRHPGNEAPLDLWQWALPRHGAVWSDLDPGDRDRLEALTRRFLETKEYEAAGDLDLDETVKVTIAAHACLLALHLGLEVYRDVHSVIVYPATVIKRGARSDPSLPGAHRACPTPLAGEAMLHGPVVLTWDAVVAATRHPEGGRNVVYHEFAHKIDMMSGAADGTPPMGSRGEELHWDAVLNETLAGIRAHPVPDPVLGTYAEVSRAELFAVATEVFFTTPEALGVHHPALYQALAAFYGPSPSPS